MIEGHWTELKRHIAVIVIDGDFNTLPSGTREKKKTNFLNITVNHLNLIDICRTLYNDITLFFRVHVTIKKGHN